MRFGATFLCSKLQSVEDLIALDDLTGQELVFAIVNERKGSDPSQNQSPTDQQNPKDFGAHGFHKGIVQNSKVGSHFASDGLADRLAESTTLMKTSSKLVLLGSMLTILIASLRKQSTRRSICDWSLTSKA